MDCIFCQIAAGELLAERVYEDEDTLAFPDLRPRAPHHLLVIPKRHLDSLASARSEADWAAVAACAKAVAEVARARGLDQSGYRVVANVGADGGQTVNHLHWHVLGGRLMTWPPG